MRFSKLDTVRALTGKLAGKDGKVVGHTQIHRNSVPDKAKYLITFADLAMTMEFFEEDLSLVEKYDQEKEDRLAKEKLLAQKAESDRIAEQKMDEALRRKIQREIEIREQVEAEMAAKKLQKTT